MVEEALSLFRQIGDPHGMAESLQILGFEEVDPARRKKYHREQLAIEEANEDIQGIATALFNIGSIGFRDCDYTSAFTAFEASRGHFRRVGNMDFVAAAGLSLAVIALLNGDLERANRCLEEALIQYREIGNNGLVAYCLFFKAMFAMTQGRYDQADELNEDAGHIAQKTGSPGPKAGC